LTPGAPASSPSEPDHNPAELAKRERAIRREADWTLGVDHGRKITVDAALSQKDTAFGQVAIVLILMNALVRAAHDREELLERWKAEAAWWRDEERAVSEQFSAFTREARDFVEAEVNARLELKYALAKRLWPIRKEVAPNPVKRPGKKDETELWGQVFERMHGETLEVFVKRAHETNLRGRLIEHQKKTYGHSRLEAEDQAKAVAA
jgi:hypothetical protein